MASDDSFASSSPSSTSSMEQTNSALASGGITHALFNQGKVSFFLKSVARFHEIRSQRILIPPFYLPTFANSSVPDPLVVRYKLTLSDEPLFLHLRAESSDDFAFF